MLPFAAVCALLGTSADTAAPPAVVTFSPPDLLPPQVACEYCANWVTYRAGKKRGSWNTAILGDGSQFVSSDGGRTVNNMTSAGGGQGWPFVRMPDGSLHNTGSAGHGGGFKNSTGSSWPSSTWWNVTDDGIVHAHNDGPAASFTGLPAPLVCNSSDDCMYGAGWAAWSQAARLSDGTFVACTAAIWLCGHFAVPAELAGIHAWASNDSYHWAWVGRAAALTELPGYPEWFGPGEGPNEHDMVLLSDATTLLVVFRVDGNDGVPPYCGVHHSPKNYHSSFSSDGGRTWMTPTAMHDATGRGMGTAYPRLLMLGGEDGVPKRLLLSGGRVFTEGVVDIEIWVNSDGMGRQWDQVHSIAYQHDRLASVVTPTHKPVPQLSKWVNLSDTSGSTTSYVSLLKLDPETALVVYSCDIALNQNKSETGGMKTFSMRVTLM